MAEIKDIKLKELHEAINARLTAAFPGVFVFTDYRRFQKVIPTPAIVVELMEIPGNTDSIDTGTGQLHVDLTFDARCIVDNLKGGGAVAVRSLALAVAGYIHETKWGIKNPGDQNQGETEVQPVSPAYVAGAFPDVWEPDIDTYECFRVEWSHSAYAGVDAFVGGEFVPTTLNIIENVADHPPLLSLEGGGGAILLENNGGYLILDGEPLG